MNQVHPKREISSVFGSTAGHLPPLVDRCYVVSQLRSTTKFPSMKEFPQPGHNMVSPLCSTLLSVPLIRCLLLGNHHGAYLLCSIQGVPAAFYPIISVPLQLLLGCEYIFVSSDFSPNHLSTWSTKFQSHFRSKSLAYMEN